jgi:prolyl-tRNA synthetase
MTSASTPNREDDYPEWFQQVIKAADMAEKSPVRVCMAIKPWGYGIWERIQRQLDNLAGLPVMAPDDRDQHPRGLMLKLFR